ncbi:hypothetical protein [Burkholderia ubonensis]|uniref:hypothetical protein n=1 Tax=Burkholderia ubonensis TaxID=101571 RepID=UPI00076DDB75|nr:hypothetical protein [Burkholderia ubonensis]KVC81419.1 hypothetical protein WI75_08720 [Burkholderia ubonensis]
MKTCYLVAVIGKTKGVLMSCYDHTEAHARSACAALFVDAFDEDGEAAVIDEGAKAGLWLEGSPEYIRSVITA